MYFDLGELRVFRVHPSLIVEELQTESHFLRFHSMHIPLQ
jgi:hypothetical protein